MPLMKEGSMPKVDQVQPDIEAGFGFVVRNDNNLPAANFSFKSKDDADAAHKKMKEILAKCHGVTGFR
jgi:hypothetical protein